MVQHTILWFFVITIIIKIINLNPDAFNCEWGETNRTLHWSQSF